MSAIPPIPAERAWVVASRAFATTLLVAAVILIGCGAPPASDRPRHVPPSPSAVARAVGDGLLVAAGAALQVTENGRLLPFEGAPDATVEVAAARGAIVVADRTGRILVSASAASGSRVWQPRPAFEGGSGPSLFGLSPDGGVLAMVVGQLQAASFDVRLVDLGSGETRSIEVTRGLDGAPVWLGPTAIAVHAIRADQSSGFTRIDVVTGAVADIPSYGVALGTSADGSRVAFDEATSGDVLVGDRDDMNDGGLDRMTRLPSSDGGVERIVLSADGRRLAIVRRVDPGSTIEILFADGAAWTEVDAIAIPGDRAVSIAWLE